MSFEISKRKYDLPIQTFFCYLQLRSFLRTNLGAEMNLPVVNDVKRLERNTLKFISKMYCLLVSEGPKPDMHKCGRKWESTDEQLSDLCQKYLVSYY